jgi:GNAT superfamily N-acetyltransferase
MRTLTTESEAALVAALTVIGRLPGAEVQTLPDTTWVAAARPLDGMNHVLRAEIDGSDASIDARIDAIHASLRERGSVPATWWIGPSTRPADLAERLDARGFIEAEPEYGMTIDLDSLAIPSAAHSGTVRAVDDAAGLDDFLAVMAGAYGWSDDGRSNAWAELYRLPLPAADAPWRHVVVRADGRPAACATLFTSGEHAFVTNVGTIPSVRGRGLGTTATLAVLLIAADLGYRRASLTASRMGRGVYARIGFREDALLCRWISPATTTREMRP